MTEGTETERFLAAHAAWETERVRLNELEDGESGDGPPRANEWHASDDDAVMLLERAVDILERFRPENMIVLDAEEIRAQYGHAGLSVEGATSPTAQWVDNATDAELNKLGATVLENLADAIWEEVYETLFQRVRDQEGEEA